MKAAATVRPIDPTSSEGIEAADALGRIAAVVIERLRAEGQPIPGSPDATHPLPP